MAKGRQDGYVRGANREEDQIRKDNHCSDDSIALQYRVFNDYIGQDDIEQWS